MCFVLLSYIVYRCKYKEIGRNGFRPEKGKGRIRGLSLLKLGYGRIAAARYEIK